jgi:hypothetical protein
MSDTTHHPSSATAPSGLRSYALAGYRWLLLAFLLAGCAQIFLAGLGVFSFGDHDVTGGTSVFDAHRTLGFTMAGVAVIIMVLAVIARPGVLAVILSAAVFSIRPLAGSPAVSRLATDGRLLRAAFESGRAATHAAFSPSTS